jgi:HAD superfamily hydrolase (TIGR01456 family)
VHTAPIKSVTSFAWFLLFVWADMQIAVTMAATRLLSKFVVLDIDGVILKGGSLVPGAVAAVKQLADHRIPYVFVTNGGGMTEANKAADLSKKIHLDVDPAQVILSHTPWRDLKETYAYSKVLVIGGEPRCLEVAHCYGFNEACSVEQVHAENPTMYPLRKPSTNQSQSSDPSAPVEAVMVFHDPVDWGLEMQAICDALAPSQLVQHPSLATPENRARGHIPLYVSNADIAYATEHPYPRFTQGAFATALKHLYEVHHKQPLHIEYCGKPYDVQYKYATQVLHQQAQHLGLTGVAHDTRHRRCSDEHHLPETQSEQQTPQSSQAVYFGVGDNPLSDIRGANNAGPQWRSILVRTGMFSDRSAANDATDPAHYVCESIVEAVDIIVAYQEDE